MAARLAGIQRALLILGIGLLALWSWNALEARTFEARATAQLAESRRAVDAARVGHAPRHARPAASPSAPRAKALPESEQVLGRIEIPRLRIHAIVAEGTDDRTLRHAVGHIGATALPGGAGNCALAGHRDTFLRGLGGVRTNDVIRIATRERTYLYRVDWTQVVLPRRVDVLDSTATRSLTLVTCYPFVYVGHAPKRFIVRATQIGVESGPRIAGPDPRGVPAVRTVGSGVTMTPGR